MRIIDVSTAVIPVVSPQASPFSELYVSELFSGQRGRNIRTHSRHRRFRCNRPAVVHSPVIYPLVTFASVLLRCLFFPRILSRVLFL